MLILKEDNRYNFEGEPLVDTTKIFDIKSIDRVAFILEISIVICLEATNILLRCEIVEKEFIGSGIFFLSESPLLFFHRIYSKSLLRVIFALLYEEARDSKCFHTR